MDAAPSYSFVLAGKVTDFMFHKCTILAIGAAIAFYLVGLGFYLKKGSLWQTIKDESRQVTRQ